MNEQEQILDLELCSGAIYRYARAASLSVTPLEANSHEKYFKGSIVGKFPERKLRLRAS